MTASVEKYVPKPPPSPKTRPKRSSAIAQLIDIQKYLYLSAKSAEIKHGELAQVARAWGDLETLKLRIKMKPAPKPVDVSQMQKQKIKRDATPRFQE